jgi:hypothetical protein
MKKKLHANNILVFSEKKQLQIRCYGTLPSKFHTIFVRLRFDLDHLSLGC